MTPLEEITVKPDNLPETPIAQVDINNIIDLQNTLDQIFLENGIFQVIGNHENTEINPIFYFGDLICDTIGQDNIDTIRSIYFYHGYIVTQYDEGDEEKEIVFYVGNIDIHSGEYTETTVSHSLIESLQTKEREAQVLSEDLEHHLDAMRQIFRANVESSQRWGEFVMDRGALDDNDIFTAEMADRDSTEFVDMTLRQIQEIARGRYMELIRFLGEYPESALSPSLREMIQTQIDTYTRMILGVGVEYNGGAGHFQQKTEEEVRFGITYGVSRCQTPEEVFTYFRSWHQDMSENWGNANALTQRQSYPLVSNILSQATYVRLQELTRGNSETDTAQIFSEFIYYLRGGETMNGRGTNWSVDVNFEIQSELTDTIFANQIIHDYFTTHQVLEKLEGEDSIGFEISDQLIGEKNCSEIMLQAGTALQKAGIDNDDIIGVINQVLGGIDSTQLNGKTYRELGIEDKFRMTCLARFIQDTEHLIFQIERHEEFGFYFAEYHNTGGRPPELTKEYLLERYRGVIIPRGIQYFGSMIGENFNGRNRMNPQDIEVLTPGERNLLSIWSDMNGYGGFFDVSDSTRGYIGTGTELAKMIAITAGLTFATGGLAIIAGGALGAARLTQVGNTVRNSAVIQGAIMGGYSVPVSRYMHPEGHDDWNERFIDLGSDYTVGIFTGLLGGALAQRYWRAGAHLKNTSHAAVDIGILGFGTEAIRNMMVYNYLHGQEEFLWVEQAVAGASNGEDYSSLPLSP